MSAAAERFAVFEEKRQQDVGQKRARDAGTSGAKPPAERSGRLDCLPKSVVERLELADLRLSARAVSHHRRGYPLAPSRSAGLGPRNYC